MGLPETLDASLGPTIRVRFRHFAPILFPHGQDSPPRLCKLRVDRILGLVWFPIITIAHNFREKNLTYMEY